MSIPRYIVDKKTDKTCSKIGFYGCILFLIILLV